MSAGEIVAMRVNSAAWRRSVITLRICAPLALAACILVGALAWTNGKYVSVAVNSFLAGINLMLTWIEWKWF